ncbi:MAG: acetolactate synthase [Gammaproteobacteria bacterium]|nr:acetolactate synthase [Gammaproteobacteria bacterium]MBK8307973.1 acetolactate synthase [Gammaproteobacteria bacterium]
MGYIHGGKVVAKALRAENVPFIFTLCGGHVMSIYDGCLDEGIRVIDVRHEQTAGHAADGWARVTGQPGVAVVTAGPGLTDAVTAVASAHRANVPMICIGSQGPRAFQDMGSLQDMNHVELMRPITKWSVSVPSANRLAEYVATAFRKATTNVPGPVFLEMPIDLLFEQVDEEQVVFPRQYRTEAGIAGDPRAIEKAFELLRKAEHPLAIVGSQYWFSKNREAYGKFVDTFQMPIYVNGAARGSLPPGHPHFFQQTRKDALKGADVVLIFGTPLDFRLGYGRPSHINASAKLIHVDLDGGELGRNRACEVGIIGDTGVVMSQLTELAESEGFQSSRYQPWVSTLRTLENDKWEKMQPQMNSDADPIDPLRACKEIDSVVDDDTFIIGDGGDFVGTAAYTVRPRKPGHWLDPGPLGTLGVGPGYAMAAKLANPKSKVFILYGDGAFGLHAMEFEAMVRQKINVIGIIGNDAAWMQIRRGQEQLYGTERSVASALSHTRYDRVVEALGGHGEYVEKARDIRPALERAIASGKPALVNIKLGRSDFRKDSVSV